MNTATIETTSFATASALPTYRATFVIGDRREELNVNDVREVEAEINGFNNARFTARGRVVINGETRRGYKFTATEASAEGIARVLCLHVHRIGVIGSDFIAVLPARG